ncbi:mucin-5AC-like isoform X3 [Eriocheir sinensis]|uniref:mucin-5AC-like isoform X3 n=1 Tax=Eriocheir sinensis TaxID=95602 RepID=UPI0021C6F8F4|nr:mucin-5AC-like isoform X3 [Eriocheir sinensis]
MGWTTSLLLLSLLGLSACQQRSLSDGGRRRQRLPLPASKAEVANFNCPQDFGYYPHPTDCTQYYVCVFGGALQESCTGGLVYSHELETCDWPRNVDCAPGATGGGVPTIIVTDPRTQSTRPISTATEALTPSVGFDRKFDHSFSSTKSHRTTQSLNGGDRSGSERSLFRQPASPKQQFLSTFSSSSFFNTPSTSNRRPTKSATFTPAPAAPSRLPSVDQSYYADANYTDPDYYYFYDDILYDYYDDAPAPATPAPTRRPTQAPIREEIFGTGGSELIHRLPPPPPPPPTTTTTTTTSTTTTTTTTTTPRPTTTTTTTTTTRPPQKLRPIPVRARVAPSTSSKSFRRAGSSSRRAGSSSGAPTASPQSFQVPNASSRLRSPSSSDSSTRDAIAKLFDFTSPDFDSTRPISSFSFSSLSPSSQQPSFPQTSFQPIPFRAPAPVPSPVPISSPVAQPHPARIPAVGSVKKPRVQTRPRATSQAIRSRTRPSFPAPNTPSQSPFTPSNSFPSSPFSSSGSRTPSTAQNRVRSPARSPSSSFNRSPSPPPSSSSSSANTRSSAPPPGPPAVDNSQPKRNRRPTLKPVSVLAPSAPSVSIDIWRYPPRRPPPTRPTPTPDTKATKCDPKVCRLPDCYCGGKDIPAGLSPAETPQLVLLTFDDSVNDLNKDLYVDLFEKGRVNPNGCPILSTMYVSHEWTDYSQVQNLYAEGHEIASHSITHSFGEQFSTSKWAKEIAGQREILSAYGGVKMEDVRGMRAPFLAVGGNKMYRMLHEQNFTYDSSMPVYENTPPSWPYTLDYRIFHDCMIPPCPTNSYPGLWQVPMVMWQDLKGGRCSMGDACTTPADAEGVYKMLIKNFERHYTSNRAPFGLFYHAAWFTTPHHKEGFIAFLDTITAMDDVWLVTNWQSLQWMRDPTPLSRVKSFGPFQCNYSDRQKCTSKKVCNVWHKGGVRYMRTCQNCPESYPWTGNTGVRSPLNDP